MDSFATTIGTQVGLVKDAGLTVAGAAFIAGMVIFGVLFLITLGKKVFRRSAK